MSHNDWETQQIETMIAAQEAGEYPPPDGPLYGDWGPDTAQDWQPEPVDISGFPFRDIPTARCIGREGLDVYTAWGHAFGRGLVTTTEFVKFLKG